MFFQYNPNFVFPSYDLKNYLDVLEIIVRRASGYPGTINRSIGDLQRTQICNLLTLAIVIHALLSIGNPIIP